MNCCFLQTCPSVPAGLHMSIPVVAWIEYKLVEILMGNWDFRGESGATNKYKTVLAHLKQHGPKSKVLVLDEKAERITIHLPSDDSGPGATQAG